MLLKNVLKVKDPKLLRVLIDQNNVYATVHRAIGGERQQETCSFLLGNCYFLVMAAGSMSIGKLASSSLVSTIFQREGKMHCSSPGRKL